MAVPVEAALIFDQWIRVEGGEGSWDSDVKLHGSRALSLDANTSASNHLRGLWRSSDRASYEGGVRDQQERILLPLRATLYRYDSIIVDY